MQNNSKFLCFIIVLKTVYIKYNNNACQIFRYKTYVINVKPFFVVLFQGKGITIDFKKIKQ